MRKTSPSKLRPILKPLLHQTKTQVLRDQLLALVQTMQPDEKLPTMRQLQEMLAVSPMTLHRALSELEAHNFIYRRQGSGTYVAPRAEIDDSVVNENRVLETVATVGLVYDRDIFGSQSSPFGSILVEEARRRAEQNNERFSLYLSLPNAVDLAKSDAIPVHDDLREAVELGRLRGVLYAGESNSQALKWLHEKRVPVVSLSYLPIQTGDNEIAYRVKIDHAKLVRLGVEALAKKGCKRIALWIPIGVGIGRCAGENSFPEMDAFRESLQKNGLEFDENLVWRAAEHTDEIAATHRETNQAQGIRAAREVFGKMRKIETQKRESSTRFSFDGLIIDDDMMTRGALTIMSKNGVRIGEELQIATHCNRGSDVLLGHEDELSLLEIDPSEIAQAMFQTLETLMKGEKPAHEILEIQPKLRA